MPGAGTGVPDEGIRGEQTGTEAASGPDRRSRLEFPVRWLEIVTVRMHGKAEGIRILEFCSGVRMPRVEGRSVSFQVFGNGLSTEFSIHVSWLSRSGPAEKSAFGAELCRKLSDFGAVEHTLWVGQD